MFLQKVSKLYLFKNDLFTNLISYNYSHYPVRALENKISQIFNIGTIIYLSHGFSRNKFVESTMTNTDE